MNNSSPAVLPAESGTALVYAFSAFNMAGLVLNSLVIVAAARPNVIPGRVPLVYLLNQLISEWLCCLFQSFAWLIDRERPVSDDGWGTFVCKLMYNRALYYSVMQATYTNIVLLMVERYVAVVHPLKHAKFTPALNASAIFLSWATGAVRAVYRYLEPQRRGHGCVLVSMDIRVFSPILVCWSLFIPVLVIAALNGRIVYVLKRQTQLLHPRAPPVAAAGVSLRTKLQRELTSSVCITCLTYMLTVSPLAIVYILMSYDVIPRDFKGTLYLMLTYLSSSFYTINPLVCLFLIKSIRNELASLLRCRWTRDPVGGTTVASRRTHSFNAEGSGVL